MSVDADIYARITGQVAGMAVYAVRLPEGLAVTGPVAVVTRVSSPGEAAIDGAVLRRQPRYQVSIYGPDLAAVRTKRDAVVTALRGYRGGSIKGCAHDGDRELYEPNVSPLYHIPIDFLISH